MDLKLKNYSSGMSVRLGFSVAIQVDAEVVLVDEVLAVGDAAFQQKCFDEFDRMKARGPHDPVRHPRHGQRRALLRPRPCCSSGARIVDMGPARRRSRAPTASSTSADARRRGRPTAARARRAIQAAWCEGADGERHVAAAAGRAVAGLHSRSSSTRSRGPAFRGHLPQRRRATRSSSPPRDGTADRALRAPASGHRALQLREPARAQPLHAHARRSATAATTPRAYACRGPGRADRAGQHSRAASSTCPTSRGGARVSVDAADDRRDRGPSAIGGDLRRFWSLTYTLAATDFKLRFFGSALGYLWTLMRPLMLFGVLYFVFTEVVRFGDDVEALPGLPADVDRAVHLLLGDDQPRASPRWSSARTCCARSASRAWSSRCR